MKEAALLSPKARGTGQSHVSEMRYPRWVISKGNEQQMQTGTRNHL